MQNKIVSTILKLLGLVFSLNLLISFLGLPIPSDNISGLYYPFKDVQNNYPNGFPYKNSLITDPIRQQFPWKYLAIQQIKAGELPLWNPYNFAGTPLLANIQSAVFYPLNLAFFLPLFNSSQLYEFALQWSLYIYLQTILSFYFFYLYARKIGLLKSASILGALSWTFSGFFTAWYEWGNIGHTILWFPLALWSIEKIIDNDHSISKITPINILKFNRYHFIFLFSLISSFFAGHWQSFSFVVINTGFYLLYRIPPIKSSFRKAPYFTFTFRRVRQWLQFIILAFIFILITSVQWLPSLEFINKSARAVDTTQWQRQDWFFPYPHLIGFIAPDYFGNPSTQNYWGVWNYGEFACYIGIAPFIFALSMIIRWLKQQYENIHDHLFKKTHKNTLDITESNIGVGFFLFCAFINLILITRNPVTELPYIYNLPFISSTQPSRGIAMVVLAMSVLASVGLHYFLKHRLTITRINPLNTSILITIFITATLWLINVTKYPIFNSLISNYNLNNYQISLSNLKLPSILIILTTVLLTIISILLKRSPHKLNTKHYTLNTSYLFTISLLILTLFDLFRFFTKFNTFSTLESLYPTPSILNTARSTTARYMADDSRLIAPNINSPYQLKTIEGYDPLYFDHYGKYIGMWTRNAPDLTPYPANRILTPHIQDSVLADLAATTHLFSFNQDSAQENISLAPVDIFGSVSLYERLTSLNYLELIADYHSANTENSVAKDLFQLQSTKHAVILSPQDISNTSSIEINSSDYINFQQKTGSNIIVNVNNPYDINLLLYRAESYDNNWQVSLDDKPSTLLRTNFSFQGLLIPPGEHQVNFRYSPMSFTLGQKLSTFGIILTIILIAVSQRLKAKL